ncbi:MULTISPECIES: PTS lactose/cellobiose transporter subunit IIA [Carnobacterium]|uniref:PTS lactose/cellobiose transporter subunit IIA n=1 Tax=Carnobacterium divergens TaxID=2748 RepID=A0A2R8A472_CARDV|nr:MULTISPECIES: PTS lactose/cellobiose transporter subunit IIA [Carnobacterium]MCO6019044.1 PTS lactose/cellobiose transporter subunit IIA [Carnobacterium divergens]MDT1940718.1 PTS lactose/cellobiose transporter subunit IIA [Carnobacterium divergens]MDT1943156.1 PTS lactose/cellobiose transporter subunit IIA [Carnobacterium divergens]MDT1948963.1 PTS lactose/cellobiose transporter subunit IIA [Carnobacterium divergens]MDT1951444.1 PTS lactose/cellobiose transporter subunit IIA [Carnobacteriu
MNLEQAVMQIIVGAGNARSLAMEAIDIAQSGDIQKAKAKLEEANEKLNEAHNGQTALLTKEASGEGVEITLLLIHGQDHLMNAITVRDLADKFVGLYDKMRGN